MKRKVYEQLLEWKSREHHKPLILNGVRQCGKTYVLKEFGRQEFDSLAYVSCDRNVNLQAIYSGDFDVARIIQGLSALTGVDIIPGKTLIFLDEVQAFPQALEALKYFCEDAPEYHIVVAGSLLGVALHAGVSFPVGKVQTLRLFPMDFEEFLMAMGEEQLLKLMHSHDYELMNAFHEKLKDLLRQYYYVGGMPEVVKALLKISCSIGCAACRTRFFPTMPVISPSMLHHRKCPELIWFGNPFWGSCRRRTKSLSMVY